MIFFNNSGWLIVQKNNLVSLRNRKKIFEGIEVRMFLLFENIQLKV